MKPNFKTQFTNAWELHLKSNFGSLARRVLVGLGFCLASVFLAFDGLGQNESPSSEKMAPFAHVTRAAESFVPIHPAPEPDLAVVAPATRSTFMARWDKIPKALGYRLDVSTSKSFNNYVNGYQGLDVGNVTGRVVTGLSRGTTYYYRTRAYGAPGASAHSDITTAATVPTTGLMIIPTFDTSITNDPNAVAIEAMINQAIAIEESLFSDQVTVSILFRYTTTADPCGPLPPGFLGRSCTCVYNEPWNTYISALLADATTTNDTTANASLPGSPLTTNIVVSGPNGRSVGLTNTPGGDCGIGPYDGVITLNSSAPLQFTRPTNPNNYDALRTTEHEMDEVMGLGAYADNSAVRLRPQDLFSWASSGTRNRTTSGSRYFSINSGTNNIVNFNQMAGGDFGDWFGSSCPQHPFEYVQNAFACPGESSDVTATSPEGINLDVIGYNPPTPTPTPGDIFVSDLGLSPSGIRRFAPDGTQYPIFATYVASYGLAFDSAGYLFAGDYFAGTIYKFAPDGTRTTFATGLAAPVGLAFDSAGYLFEADRFSGNIYKFAPDGTQSTFATGLFDPTGLAFDSAGNLFVGSFMGGTIYKFAPDGTRTTFTTGFVSPWGLAFDNAGNLFVANTYHGRITKYLPDGTYIIFTEGLNDPRGLAFDNTGYLFVSEQGGCCQDGNLYKFAPNGTRTFFWGIGQLEAIAIRAGIPTPTPTPTASPTPTPTASPTPTPTPTGPPTYITTTGTGSIVPGTTDIGNHCDDCTTAIMFPFPVSVYGQTFNTGNVSSNGNLQFTSNYSGIDGSCPFPNALYATTVVAYMDDLRTDQVSPDCASLPGGCGVFISVTGTAPDRQLNIEWRTGYFNRSGTANFEMRFYENTQSFFDIFYGATADAGSGESSGVQAGATGSATTFSCLTPTLTNGLRVTYTYSARGMPTQAVSRKLHSGSPFDINLPLTGTPGIECRAGGATSDYTVVVNFSGNVTVTGNPQAEVTLGTGCVGPGGVCNGNVSVTGNVVTIPLTNIANAQTINVRLNGVNIAAGDAPATDFTIPMSILISDTNADGAVNAADVAQTKARLGQNVGVANFRSDVNANGSINAGDVSIIKSHLGTGLP